MLTVDEFYLQHKTKVDILQLTTTNRVERECMIKSFWWNGHREQQNPETD